MTSPQFNTDPATWSWLAMPCTTSRLQSSCCRGWESSPPKVRLKRGIRGKGSVLVSFYLLLIKWCLLLFRVCVCVHFTTTILQLLLSDYHRPLAAVTCRCWSIARGSSTMVQCGECRVCPWVYVRACVRFRWWIDLIVILSTFGVLVFAFPSPLLTVNKIFYF